MVCLGKRLQRISGYILDLRKEAKMGITEVLTIVFVVLKLVHVIEWSWFLVLLPEIIGLIIYIVVAVLSITHNYKLYKRINKKFDELDKL